MQTKKSSFTKEGKLLAQGVWDCRGPGKLDFPNTGFAFSKLDPGLLDEFESDLGRKLTAAEKREFAKAYFSKMQALMGKTLAKVKKEYEKVRRAALRHDDSRAPF